MPEGKIFIPLEKVDESKRLIYATIAAEQVDETGEIMDYASSKPAFEKWSKAQQERSGGKSFGNVRAMHAKVAAGKLVSPIEANDELKKFTAVIEVVDDDTWKKVLTGVYTGISAGGGYAKAWADPKNPKAIRYTPIVREVSICDVPCMADATFQLVKADGSTELRKFSAYTGPVQGFRAKDGSFHEKKVDAIAADEALEKSIAAALEDADDDHPAVAQLKELENKLQKADLSDEGRKKAAETGIAEPDGSYPIANKDDLAKAVKAFGRSKNKVKTKAHIKARAKAIGATGDLPAKWQKTWTDGTLEKSLAHVARLADLTQQLEWLRQAVEAEELLEKDEAGVQHDSLATDISNLLETLQIMTHEECAEMADCPGDYMEKFVAATTLEKTVATRLEKFSPLFARFKEPAASPTDQALTKLTNDLSASRKENEKLEKTVGELTAGMSRLEKQIDVISRQPVPFKGAIRAVDRGSELPNDKPLEKAAPKDEKASGVTAHGSLSPADQRLLETHYNKSK